MRSPPANGQVVAVQFLPTDWLIYDEMTRAHRIASIRCCSVVSPLTVAIFGGCAKLPSTALQEPAIQKDDVVNESSDSEMEDRSMAHLDQMKIDEWLNFKLDREMVGLVFQLRQKWHGLFLRRIRSPSKPWSQLDENTIRALVSVLGAEDQTVGLQQPTGIGQRPRPMSSEDPPQTSSWRNANSKRTPGPTASTDDELFIPTPSRTATDRSSRLSPAWALLQPKVLHGSRDKCSKLSTDDHSSTTNSPESASLCLHSPCASPSPTSSGKCSKSPSPRPGGVTVRYFIMKSSNLRNIDISQQRGIWSTTPSNELKLNRAFLESSLVFLVFSVQGSGHFQGYAWMMSVIGQERCQDWGSTGLGVSSVWSGPGRRACPSSMPSICSTPGTRTRKCRSAETDRSWSLRLGASCCCCGRDSQGNHSSYHSNTRNNRPHLYHQITTGYTQRDSRNIICSV